MKIENTELTGLNGDLERLENALKDVKSAKDDFNQAKVLMIKLK